MKEFTPQFKNWFGNSKVVDAKGNPLRVYHGTGVDFDVFDFAKVDIGMHFGTRDQAQSRIKARKDYDHSIVLSCYLSIQNPLELEDEGNFFGDRVAPQLYKMGLINKKTRERWRSAWISAPVEVRKPLLNEMRKFLLSKGYDGIVYKNNYEGSGNKLSYIVFSPNQIKSATGNNGNYSREDERFNEGIVTEYQEKGSTFSHEGHVYDLNRLFKISKNIVPMNIDIDDLSWILKQSKPESDERVEKANIKVPILVTKYKGKILVIDGLHRLAKAIKLGKENLPCKFILPEILTTSLKEEQTAELFSFMTESKVIRNERDAQKYTVKELSEILFSMMLGIHLIGTTEQSKKYCLNSLKFPKFDHIFLSSTDLANAISSLRNAKEYLGKPNVDVPMIELKRYLRGIILGNNTAAFSRAFFMRLQTKLRIKDATLLIMRREIVDGETVRNKEKLADKLYQNLRLYNNCDILVLLQGLLDGSLTESNNKVVPS